MLVKVGTPGISQLLTTLKDSVGESRLSNKDIYCGAREYSLTPQLSFLKMEGLNLVLNTDNPTNEG